MTFDLSPDQSTAQARARDIATVHLAPVAAAIDASGTVPASALDAIAAHGVWHDDAVTTMLVIEELAAESPAGAARAALESAGTPANAAGLRAVGRVDAPTEKDYLAMAAVCLGIGRAALAEALDVARARGDRPAGEPADPPHWLLADAATDVDGARLLLHAAASGSGLSAAAALVHAAGAATRAVDAAIRVAGPAGYLAGGALERLARDARAVWVILGAEDQARRVAADALLP